MIKTKSIKAEAAPAPAGGKYNEAYAAAQAGGMNETDSHEFALDQSTRRYPTARDWECVNFALAARASSGCACNQDYEPARQRILYSKSVLEAAPALLAALEACYKAICDAHANMTEREIDEHWQDQNLNSARKQARAVIAQAKGGDK